MTTPVFPTLIGLSWPAIRTPVWDTDVQVSIAGKRTGYARRAYPQYAYELSYDLLRSDSVNLEWQTLVAFFNVCFGRANLFIFNDPDDGSVTTANFGTGDGTTTAFQLTRALTGTGVSWVDPIFCPTGTPSIFVNGSLKTLGTDYTISATGLVTFNVAPAAAAALTWTGTYGWFCRFDEDSNSFEKFMLNFWQLKKIKFSTELF
jgi:uncharacterized protein (TIGR02217 family)